MSDHIRKSIQELQDKLKKQLADVEKTKQAINILYETLDEPAPYKIEGEAPEGTMSIRPDSFFGKGLATAVGEYLEMRGHAVPVSEIMAGLQNGGYDFGNAKFPERVLRINLAKNSVKFVSIKGSDSFGLRKWYPNLQAPTKTSKSPTDNSDTNSSDDEQETDITPDSSEEVK